MFRKGAPEIDPSDDFGVGDSKKNGFGENG
jgi:hypothetical protein